MLKLRKMLTEILLEVTNEEIESVAYETYEEEKNKVKFVFKEPKIKPKRAKPNVLGKLLYSGKFSVMSFSQQNVSSLQSIFHLHQ